MITLTFFGGGGLVMKQQKHVKSVDQWNATSTCNQWMKSVDVFGFVGDILEIGVQWSVLKGDIQSFERYMAQLKPYYFDYR